MNMLKRDANKLKVKQKLMDAAEELFSQQGFEAVSVREITQRAESRLADINDHFGGKAELFKEVLARRASILSRDYENMLLALSRNGSLSDQVNALVSAFTAPLLNRSKEDGAWLNYLRLLSRNNSLTSRFSAFPEYFNPITERFTQELGKLFPASPERKVNSAYQLMSTCTMMQFADELPQDVPSSSDKYAELEHKLNEMLEFVKGGILELLEEKPQTV